MLNKKWKGEMTRAVEEEREKLEAFFCVVEIWLSY